MNEHQHAAGNFIRNNPRKAGGLFLFIGGFSVYQGIIRPVQEATEGAGTISVSEKLSMLGVLGVVLGLALLIGGARVASITHPEPGKSRVFGVSLLIGLFILGGVAFYMEKAHLQSMGYVFNR
jgi:hypothetical protein